LIYQRHNPDLPGEEVAQTKFLTDYIILVDNSGKNNWSSHLTRFVKFVDLSQGFFERNVFIASVWIMEVEYADLVGAKSFERRLE
jgi:hypothetical protein